MVVPAGFAFCVLHHAYSFCMLRSAFWAWDESRTIFCYFVPLHILSPRFNLWCSRPLRRSRALPDGLPDGLPAWPATSTYWTRCRRRWRSSFGSGPHVSIHFERCFGPISLQGRASSRSELTWSARSTCPWSACHIRWRWRFPPVWWSQGSGRGSWGRPWPCPKESWYARSRQLYCSWWRRLWARRH